jgi:hypothetical protein
VKIIGHKSPGGSTRVTSPQADTQHAEVGGFQDNFNPPWPGLDVISDPFFPQFASSYDPSMGLTPSNLPVAHYVHQGGGSWSVDRTFDPNDPALPGPGYKAAAWRLTNQPHDHAQFAVVKGHATLGISALDAGIVPSVESPGLHIGLGLLYYSSSGFIGVPGDNAPTGVGLDLYYAGPNGGDYNRLTVTRGARTTDPDFWGQGFETVEDLHPFVIAPPFYVQIDADVTLDKVHVQITSDRAGAHVLRDYPDLTVVDPTRYGRHGALPVFPMFRAEGNMLATDQVGQQASNVYTGGNPSPLIGSLVGVNYFAWTYEIQVQGQGDTLIASTVHVGGAARGVSAKHRHKQAGHAKSGIRLTSPMSS